MAKRIKVSAPTLESRTEAENALGEIRELTIERARIILTTELQKKHIEDKTAPRLTEIDKSILAKTEQLKTWSESNPQEFGGKKSLDLTHGKIGFRKGQPHLKPLKNFSWEKILETLRNAGQILFIRTKEEVDKEALLKHAQDPGVSFPLASFGLRIKQEEPFFVEPKVEEQETRITTENAVSA